MRKNRGRKLRLLLRALANFLLKHLYKAFFQMIFTLNSAGNVQRIGDVKNVAYRTKKCKIFWSMTSDKFKSNFRISAVTVSLSSISWKMWKKNKILYVRARGEIVAARALVSLDRLPALSAQAHPNKWLKGLEVCRKTQLSRINWLKAQREWRKNSERIWT